MRVELEDSGENALDMAPLIDVVFLLLVFFMVATSFSREEQQLDLELPKAASGAESAAAREELVIDVLESGIRVAGQEVSAEAFPARLADAARADRLRPVLVRADRGLDYGRVIEVLDQCRLAGLTNAGLATREG